MQRVDQADRAMISALDKIRDNGSTAFERHQGWHAIFRALMDTASRRIGPAEFNVYFNRLRDPIKLFFMTEENYRALQSCSRVVCVLLDKTTEIAGKRRVLRVINHVSDTCLVYGVDRLKDVLNIFVPKVVDVIFDHGMTEGINSMEKMMLCGIRNDCNKGPGGREAFVKNLLKSCKREDVGAPIKFEVLNRLVKTLLLAYKKDTPQNPEFVRKVHKKLKKRGGIVISKSRDARIRAGAGGRHRHLWA